MQAYRALSDRQSQTGAATLSVVCFCPPVERLEYMRKILLGNAGPVVAYGYREQFGVALELDFNGGGGGRVADSVAQNVFKSAAQKIANPAELAALAGNEFDLHIARICFEGSVVHHILKQSIESDGFHRLRYGT